MFLYSQWNYRVRIIFEIRWIYLDYTNPNMIMIISYHLIWEHIIYKSLDKKMLFRFNNYCKVNKKIPYQFTDDRYH